MFCFKQNLLRLQLAKFDKTRRGCYLYEALPMLFKEFTRSSIQNCVCNHTKNKSPSSSKHMSFSFGTWHVTLAGQPLQQSKAKSSHSFVDFPHIVLLHQVACIKHTGHRNCNDDWFLYKKSSITRQTTTCSVVKTYQSKEVSIIKVLAVTSKFTIFRLLYWKYYVDIYINKLCNCRK